MTHDLHLVPPLFSTVTIDVFRMSTEKQQAKTAVQRADEELLATLGYKQEFQRAFTGLEVSDIALHSIKTE